MAIYALIDMQVTDDGDLVLDDIGDFKIASPSRTVIQCINNIILTNKGELLTDVNFGANLQTYYGSSNSRQNHQLMEREIIEEVRRQGYIELSDIEVDITPVDINEAAIIVEVKGQFIETEDTGSFGSLAVKYDGVSHAYLYPFTSGRIVPVT